jgi:transposase, IS5 family
MSGCLHKRQKIKTRFTHYMSRRFTALPKVRIISLTFGNKVFIASTAQGNLIVGVVSHGQNLHDSYTLPEVLNHIEVSRGKSVKQAVCDRGYRGKQTVNGTAIVLPKKPLKRDSRYQRDKKRKQCRRRAAIEPIIGHMKSDYRLSR